MNQGEPDSAIHARKLEEVRTIGQRRIRALVDGFIFIGNTEAMDILNVKKGNVAKTLKRHGVEPQTLRVGNREMAAYLIDDVKRVERILTADGTRRTSDAKRRETARAKVAA